MVYSLDEKSKGRAELEDGISREAGGRKKTSFSLARGNDLAVGICREGQEQSVWKGFPEGLVGRGKQGECDFELIYKPDLKAFEHKSLPAMGCWLQKGGSGAAA